MRMKVITTVAAGVILGGFFYVWSGVLLGIESTGQLALLILTAMASFHCGRRYSMP